MDARSADPRPGVPEPEGAGRPLHGALEPGAGVDVSVVVPTWNGRDRIRDTLGSLARQTFPTERFEVVVVDDGSTDGTDLQVASFIRSHPGLQVHVVRQANGGVNAARNAGVHAARGSVIAFLDDDELAPAEHLERIWHLLAEHPAWPGVGGPALVTGSESIRTCAVCSVGTATIDAGPTGTTPRLLGGNMAVRRSVVADVGDFDVELSGRGDENEWFARADREFHYEESLAISHRRDHVSGWVLCRTAFRQGKALPVAQRKLGRTWRPSPGRLARYLLHGVRRRCWNGPIMAARELGAASGWIRSRADER